jgi:hypothetical protein
MNAHEVQTEWEIVDRRGNYGWLGILTMLFMGSGAEPTSITLTVREKSTGTTKTITAYTDGEAAAKLANRQFDQG